MNDPHLIEKKKILTLRVKNNIENEEWEKLIAALSVAEEYGISKELLYRGWKEAGSYLEGKDNLTEAILCYNKARKIKPSIIFVFDKIVSLAEKFFVRYRLEYSTADLNKLRDAILLLQNFHSVRFPNQKAVLVKSSDLIQRINYQIEYYPKEAIETKATHQIDKIYDAITDDMTMPEVHQEVARILTNIIRRETGEKSTKGQKKKKKSKKRK